MKNQDFQQLLQTTYQGLESNNFASLGHPEKPLWDPPIFGIASGDDEYFTFLKEHIGPFHWSPREVFGLKYGDGDLPEPSRLRVISIAFPQTAETKASQEKETLAPCRNWIVSRGEWEPLMKDFSGRLVDQLESQGIRAVSIDLQPEFHVVKDGPLGISSTWSHRHAAYAAGLGTFGLSDGLITEKGKAVRFTTMVVEAPLAVTTRTYESPYEWCLYYQDGSCGLCVHRCPTQAITRENGHDKDACLAYEDYFAEHYWPEGLDPKDYILGCGLCQVGIPCQDKRP